MKPGDVVIAAFPGATVTKTRPALVLSTETYHRTRPDVILGLVTSQRPTPFVRTDCELRDWKTANLHAPSYSRLYVVTLPQTEIRSVGRLSDECVRAGLSQPG